MYNLRGTHLNARLSKIEVTLRLSGAAKCMHRQGTVRGYSSYDTGATVLSSAITAY
jgi:hypothetical protein